MKTPRGARGLRFWLLALLALSGGVLSGCAAEGTEAAEAAEAFHRDVASSDMTAACSRLQSKTREETARSSDAGTCESQLEKANIPDPGKLLSTEQFGRDAFIEFENDTVFLAASDAGWRITGAGCTANGEEAPYTCEVGGK
ncbi:hypothetical protein [Arthrobacter globiformis]|uniref:hypothetical protein n=1 Tax=Arthrobacter globiformis TaxID=1665 RepID=UPI00278F1C67|nr:hypothetical protein [Arthrobacter globiformis]MDQ0620211.1 hypothetical protein [Arthrobacter globiformis]